MTYDNPHVIYQLYLLLKSEVDVKPLYTHGVRAARDTSESRRADSRPEEAALYSSTGPDPPPVRSPVRRRCLKEFVESEWPVTVAFLRRIKLFGRSCGQRIGVGSTMTAMGFGVLKQT
jgi:hypothetical protein